MFAPLTRRGLLGSLVASVLALLRPADALGSAACSHPAHQALCAARPGRGLWYRVGLSLVCPRCGAAVTHRGYLPGTAAAVCTPVVTPDDRVPPPVTTSWTSYDADGEPRAAGTTTVYDAAGRLVAIHDPRPS